MRVILTKIIDWWQVLRNYIRSRTAPPPEPPKPWVVMGGLTEEEEDRIEDQKAQDQIKDSMDDFDDVLFDGDSYNTKSI
jgi:hypothetical protein